ncbi:MAG: hypothetical protein ABSD70_14950 [Terracidiphilus sp.]
MIRQAITCDICGIDKRQTNHWFVAYEQAGELRVSGWTSRHRLRADSKHLCGQKCLHKLVDDFIAKSIASRARSAADKDGGDSASACQDTSLTSGEELESSARLLIATPQIASLPAFGRESRIAATQERQRPEDLPPEPAGPARYSSRSWHAEAWQRERERELRAIENHPEVAERRGSSVRRGL